MCPYMSARLPHSPFIAQLSRPTILPFCISLLLHMYGKCIVFVYLCVRVCIHICVYLLLCCELVYARTISSYPVILHSYPAHLSFPYVPLCAQPTLICVISAHLMYNISSVVLEPPLIKHNCTQAIWAKKTIEEGIQCVTFMAFVFHLMIILAK